MNSLAEIFCYEISVTERAQRQVCKWPYMVIKASHEGLLFLLTFSVGSWNYEHAWPTSETYSNAE